MYIYVVVLNQITPMVGKTLFCGPGWRRGDNKFSVLFIRETGNFLSSSGGNKCFYNIHFQFQEPLLAINDKRFEGSKGA